MSVEACTRFYQEKHGQAAKVFAERYSAIVAQGEKGMAEWAAERQPELYRKMKSAEREVDALWQAGECSEEFKRQVLTYLRAWLEICRLYAAEIGKQLSSEVA